MKYDKKTPLELQMIVMKQVQIILTTPLLPENSNKTVQAVCKYSQALQRLTNLARRNHVK